MFKKINLSHGKCLRILNSTAVLPLSRFNTNTSPRNSLQACKSRSYSTAAQFPHQNYSWPSNPSFTPYDVLNLPRSATYSKRNYYDLVKIYHPDRALKDHPLFHQLTAETRLQRYRIIVDAHELLSDPIKRAAYDRNGTGWVHTVLDTTIAYDSHGPNIYSNATWEDWEDWYNRHQGPQQHVVDQRTFSRLVILLVLFAGALQASWIGQVNNDVTDRLRETNAKSARVLQDRKDSTIKQMDSNDARVQGFLIRRDPTGSGLKENEQPVYQMELNPRRGLDESSQVGKISQELAQPADIKSEASEFP
ncbi:Hsp40 co-chaperone Jid1, putative [Penicillium digitatum]|uniref:Hsp40 co-chaperone Jid1, putative n=3 Tax=Penicillium digitatum TaxID=36651 RepID=K9F940_PEND2|nr:Hsp40 co-chaperone Jid1, putative [Penicillium digitatum Pd1]EKV05910.1 Hsp40 co-chaperone Jid1, putative [Penicillium digitatum PHI26]EKV17838.1 Hsp40 co-chaperone Jid1, putative [Penicillium digitatum Pd1]QQK46956.1 Hsp40 co-chaperone Jid1, putative [Penicillium digitatum]